MDAAWQDEADRLRAQGPKGILFLCVANSARSQMAEGDYKETSGASAGFSASAPSVQGARASATRRWRRPGIWPRQASVPGVRAGRGCPVAGGAVMEVAVAAPSAWWLGLLGVLFALSFCPISAALFFGSLVPLAVANDSGLLLPAVYGLGTGLPVLALAFVVAAGAKSIGTAFRRLSVFEKWARRTTGAVFIVVGIYLSLEQVCGVLS